MFTVQYSFATQAEMENFVGSVSKKPVGRPAGATAATSNKAASPPPAAASKVSKAEAVAMLQKVRDEKDTPTAKAIVKKLGFEKMADITEDKAEEAYKLAKAALEAGSTDDLNDGDDL